MEAKPPGRVGDNYAGLSQGVRDAIQQANTPAGQHVRRITQDRPKVAALLAQAQDAGASAAERARASGALQAALSKLPPLELRDRASSLTEKEALERALAGVLKPPRGV